MKTILFFKNLNLRIKSLVVIFSVFYSLSASSQIIYLGSSSAAIPGNNLNKLTFLHTIAPFTNFLVVTVTTQDKSITSVKYGQLLLTAAISKTSQSMWVAIYYLVNPIQGTDVVTVETTSSTDISAGASNFGNVSISSPIIQTESSAAKSSSASLTITNNSGNINKGEMVIDAIGCINKSVTNSVSQTLAYNILNSYPNASSFKAGTPPSTTTNWKLSESGEWAMVGIVIKAEINNVLPVKLTSFNANLSLDQSKVNLTWTTASEINANRFVVERSTDGSNFTEAGTVLAIGNSVTSKNYQFSDKVNAVNATVIYYRLRQVDMDGKVDYSATRIVRISKQTDNMSTLLTYPNPVINELQITIPANWQNKKVSYEIFNPNGQVANKTDRANSSQTETLKVNNLAPGFYIIRVSCEGQVAQQKIIKH